jgi:hypothetical protein
MHPTWEATAFNQKSQPIQISTLVYSTGDKAEEIFSSIPMSEDASKDYATVVRKLETYFVKKRNVIFERAKFNQRPHEEGECVDTFITDLYTLAEHCQFANLHDELICDRTIVGLKDDRLSEKLQLDAELTLEKAVTPARQSETVKKQQLTMRNQFQDKTEGEVAFVRKPIFKKPAPMATPTKDSCSRCGHTPSHSRAKCPARDTKWYSCQSIGHYGTVCKSKSVSAINVESVYDEHEEGTPSGNFCLESLTEADSQPWTIELKSRRSNDRVLD